MVSERRAAVVTGGGSGMGEAMAKRLAHDGLAVAIVDLDTAGAERVAGEACANGDEAIAVGGVDVSSRAQVDDALQRVRDALGPILVLVNNAGITGSKPFLEITDDEWDRMMAVNLSGAFYCTQAVVPDMIAAGWGRIVNISSSSAQGGQARMVHYVSSKAGMIGMTKALAHEFGPNGITVNTIPPGSIDTPMFRAAADSGLLRADVDAIAARTPVRRTGRPEDIAGRVCVPRLRGGRLHHGPDHRGQRGPRHMKDELVGDDEGVLDPWVAEWFRANPMIAEPFELSDETLALARAFADAPLGVPARDIAKVTDDVVAGVRVRIYEHDAPPTGLIVYFHGGGFCIGSVGLMDNVARELAHCTGAAVVSVEYRLAPEHPYPAGLDDCEAVTRWALTNTTRFGVSPRRVAVAGESAGGNLSAAVALRLRAEPGESLAGQVLIYPVVDDNAAKHPSREQFDGIVLTTSSRRAFWDAYTSGRDLNRDPFVAPLHAESLAGLPPAIVVLGGCDLLRDEGRLYACRLRAEDVRRRGDHLRGAAARVHQPRVPGGRRRIREHRRLGAVAVRGSLIGSVAAMHDTACANPVPVARNSPTPASNEHMCEKAARAGADLVFLDLEDACAPAVKESARATAVGALTNLDWGRTVRAVRINGVDTPWCHGDIIDVVTGARDALDVLIVPKARSARATSGGSTFCSPSWRRSSGCHARLRWKCSSRKQKRSRTRRRSRERARVSRRSSSARGTSPRRCAPASTGTSNPVATTPATSGTSPASKC